MKKLGTFLGKSEQSLYSNICFIWYLIVCLIMGYLERHLIFLSFRENIYATIVSRGLLIIIKKDI